MIDTTAARALWYPAGPYTGTVAKDGAKNLAANTLVTMSATFAEDTNLGNLGYYCTFLTGGSFVGIGVYEWSGDQNSYPGTLLAEVNSLPQAVGFQSAANTTVIPGGTKVMFGLVGDAVVNLQYLTDYNTSMTGIGYPAGWQAAGTYQYYGWSVAHAYVPGNGMPDPFPGGGALYNGNNGRLPGIWFGGY